MLRIPHKTDYKAFSFKSYSHIVVSLVRTIGGLNRSQINEN